MYIAKLHENAPEEIFIEGDWFVPAGKSRLGVQQVEYSENFAKKERIGFLKHCQPYNLVLWPSTPFSKVRSKSGQETTKIDVSVSRVPGRLYHVMPHRKPGLDS